MQPSHRWLMYGIQTRAACAATGMVSALAPGRLPWGPAVPGPGSRRLTQRGGKGARGRPHEVVANRQVYGATRCVRKSARAVAAADSWICHEIVHQVLINETICRDTAYPPAGTSA